MIIKTITCIIIPNLEKGKLNKLSIRKTTYEEKKAILYLSKIFFRRNEKTKIKGNET
jgi:hypothetical protein